MLRLILMAILVSMTNTSEAVAAPGDTFLAYCNNAGTPSLDSTSMKEAIVVLKNYLGQESCEKAKLLLASRSSIDLGEINVDTVIPFKDLIELRELHVSGTNLRDLTPLSDLKKLTKLSLTGAQITDLAGLENLVMLESLSIITDSALSLDRLSSPKLRHLTIGTPVSTDLKRLADFTDITYLYLDIPTPLSPSEPFAFLAKLHKLEWLFINAINFHGQAKHLANLPIKNLSITSKYGFLPGDEIHLSSLSKLEFLTIDLGQEYKLINSLRSPTLKSLAVNTNFWPMDDSLFSEVLPKGDFKHLAINYNSHGEQMNFNFSEGHLKKLESLALYPSDELNAAEMVANLVLPDLSKLDDLRNLELELDIGPELKEKIQAITDQVALAPKIQKFSLSQLAGDGSEDFTAKPRSSLRLSSFSPKALRQLSINGFDFDYLPTSTYTGLRYLDLADSNFNDPRNLNPFKDGKALRLSRTPIPSSPGFPDLPTLQWIDISGTAITQSESLWAFKGIEEIYATESKIGSWEKYLKGDGQASSAPAWIHKIDAKFSPAAEPLDYPSDVGILNLSLAASELETELTSRIYTLAKIQGIDNSQEYLETSCWQILYHFKEHAQLTKMLSESIDSSHSIGEFTKPICATDDKLCRESPLRLLYKTDLSQCLWVQELIEQQPELLATYSSGAADQLIVDPIPRELADYYTIMTQTTVGGSQLQETVAAKNRLKELVAMAGSTAEAIARIKSEATRDLESSISRADQFLKKVTKIRSRNVVNLQQYREKIRNRISEGSQQVKRN